MRVIVYSPVRLFGDCIAAFLRSADSIDAVCAEHSVLELDRTALSFQADVVLVDITAGEARAAARLVKALNPEVSTVAVAVADVPEEIVACAESGFDAYVPRVAQPEEMIEIIHRAHRGETVCTPRIARLLFNELARRHPAAGSETSGDVSGCRLTPREVDIARLLGRGAANKEIAAELHLSVATIKNHVHSVLHKLDLDSRAQVATLLLENPLALRLA